MLYCDRINVFERVDVNKTNKSKGCDICHYWYILYKGFNFQSDVCNGRHEVLMISMNLSDSIDYRIVVLLEKLPTVGP